MHGDGPALLGGAAHQPERQLVAPHGREVALPVQVQVFAPVVFQVVGVQVQLGAVHEIRVGGQYGLFFLHKGLVQRGRHRRLDAHHGDVPLRLGDGRDHPVRAMAGPQVEAQLVQPRLAQRLQVFRRGQRAVGVHVLVDAGLVEAADDAVVLFDLHEGLQVHVGDAGGPVGGGQQQIEVLLPEAGAADLPVALADGRLEVHLTAVIAERAGQVAAVGLAHGAQPRAQQAGAAAPGEAGVVAHVAGPPTQGFEPRDVGLQPVDARRLGELDLGQRRQRDLLLPRRKGLVLGQPGEEFKPGQGVGFGYVHGRSIPSSVMYPVYRTPPALSRRPPPSENVTEFVQSMDFCIK